MSFNVRDTSNVAGDDETVTVKITNVTTDKVSVKYVNGDTNGALATVSAAKTVKVGTADSNFKFTVDTSSTATSLKYSVTGLKTAADNVTDKTFTTSDKSEQTVSNTTGAKGDAYADTTGKDLCTIAVNGNITIAADDVTVEAIPVLAIESAKWTANTVVINFNDGELGAKADKAASYTAPTGGSIAAVEVSGNTVTLTIADVLVAAGSTVKVGTDAGLATETTITMAADGTGTI